MVFEPEVFDYIGDADDANLESHTLERLASEGQLAGYRHDRFWQSASSEQGLVPSTTGDMSIALRILLRSGPQPCMARARTPWAECSQPSPAAPR